ncbi:hypothetical protein Tco_0804134 [Tanacetum coccineum]|uniref:Uncharacterized protein n=1 Tax=Tanacetum coccineum TaxID=301880 RepID=A0ABQ5A617_9ASTR
MMRRMDVVFDGAFGGVGDEEVVVGEGVVVTSSSLDMLTNSCLGGIIVSLIFMEELDEEALVEFMGVLAHEVPSPFPSSSSSSLRREEDGWSKAEEEEVE